MSASIQLGVSRLVISASVACIVAAPAFAQIADGEAICFGRAYSLDHLAAHPGQSVVEMQITMDGSFYGEPDDHVGPTMVETTVRAMVRDRFGEFFANSAICQWDAQGSRYDCGIDCDGGRFQVELDADGTAMLLNADWGFVLYGGCGEDIEAGREVNIPADAEHAAFRLYPLPAEACPFGLWQMYDAGLP